MVTDDILKALQNEKRREIIENIPEEGVTVKDICKKFNIKPASAQRHLEKLEIIGILYSSEEPCDNIGRPRRRFKLNQNFKNSDIRLGSVQISLNIDK